MYINSLRPRELRKPKNASRKSENAAKEFSEELEAIVDSVTIDSIDPDKERDAPKKQKKSSPEKTDTDPSGLSVTA